MRRIIKLGRPTHRTGRRMGWTACGINSWNSTRDPDKVDCLRCLKAKKPKL